MPDAAARPDPSGDVHWSELPGGSYEAVPLGNGRVVASVWFEPEGRLRAYLARADSWSAHSRLLKTGRFTVKVHGADWSRAALHLSLARATLTARLGATTWKLWVDEAADVLCVAADLDQEREVEVTVEPWRAEPRALERSGDGTHDYGERWSAWGSTDLPPGGVVETPDEVIAFGDCIAALHENTSSSWADTLAVVGLDPHDFGPDPLAHRVTGIALTGCDLTARGARLSGRVDRLRLVAAAVTTATGGRSGWMRGARAAVRASSGGDDAYRSHVAWWRSFWARSRLVASGDTDADAVSAAYVRQRYMAAIAGRGPHPFPFNGSLFTVDRQSEEHPYDADFRAWGGAYWWQNTRLAYWPLLTTGDLDLVDPLFAMYRNAVPIAEAWVRRSYRHGGVVFPEVMHFWGTWTAADYGRDREGRHPGWVQQPYIRMLWTGSLELAAMAFERWRQSPDDGFLRTTLLPLADGVLTFFAEHYGVRDGRLSLSPAQALETFWSVDDPAPDIAGLHHLVPRLLASGIGSRDMRTRWEWLARHLPALPRDDHALRPAGRLRDPTPRNRECPELYALFPFDVGVPQEALDATFDRRRVHPPNCWHQDDLWAACLGRTSEAVEGLVRRAGCTVPGFRWPATWNGQHDWAPDLDHGGVLMLTKQRLALHGADRNAIGSAWPREWALDGLLHTAGGVVEVGA